MRGPAQTCPTHWGHDWDHDALPGLPHKYWGHVGDHNALSGQEALSQRAGAGIHACKVPALPWPHGVCNTQRVRPSPSPTCADIGCTAHGIVASLAAYSNGCSLAVPLLSLAAYSNGCSLAVPLLSLAAFSNGCSLAVPLLSLAAYSNGCSLAVPLLSLAGR